MSIWTALDEHTQEELNQLTAPEKQDISVSEYNPVTDQDTKAW
jgi:hypothetical protein